MKNGIAVLLLAVLLFSCESKEDRFNRIKSCRYVFYDSNEVMHLDENCSVLKSDKKHEKDRIEKYNLDDRFLNYGSKCSECITDDDYIELKRYVEKSWEIEKQKRGY